MFTPLLTFQIVACWVADTVGLGDCAWSPPGDLPVPIAPSSHLDQPRISSPIVSPLIPARACSYAWQRFSSSTSPTTWGQCGLHNLHNITKSSGHDTGWRKMFTPLLTFQIVACWVADTVGLGDCAWSPPGDLPVPIAPSSHLDQPRISSPIVSPLIPARACSYAWQRFSSSTSPTTAQCSDIRRANKRSETAYRGAVNLTSPLEIPAVNRFRKPQSHRSGRGEKREGTITRQKEEEKGGDGSGKSAQSYGRAFVSCFPAHGADVQGIN
ncbi:hypothetical protein MRX96_036757 [Rhipicephalus microplus]